MKNNNLEITISRDRNTSSPTLRSGRGFDKDQLESSLHMPHVPSLRIL